MPSLVPRPNGVRHVRCEERDCRSTVAFAEGEVEWRDEGDGYNQGETGHIACPACGTGIMVWTWRGWA